MDESVDYERALLSPASVFVAPEEVLRRADLTKAQKIESLRRWEYDASEVSVPEEEGMTGGELPMLRRILLALDRLTGDTDLEHTPPTKQGGL